MTPEEKAVDRRYQKTFGKTLNDYNITLAKQGGVCKICNRPPKKNRLSWEHDHRFDKIKITLEKMSDGRWAARANSEELNVNIAIYGPDRKILKENCRLLVRSRSIRGLACMTCNRGLQYFRDSPERLDSAAIYLRNFNQKLGFQ